MEEHEIVSSSPLNSSSPKTFVPKLELPLTESATEEEDDGKTKSLFSERVL
jgi:hypothetical protein